MVLVIIAGKLASIAGDREDFERISNVYVDLQNLAEELHLDIIWTAHHITREGKKHRLTRYDENDISGSIAIVRNAQVIMGLNSTEHVELRITMEAFGTDHKNQIVTALTDAGYRPKLVKFKGAYNEM